VKKTLLYFTPLVLIPFSYVTGGVDSPARFLYFPLLAFITPLLSPAILLQSSLLFSVFYSLLPVAHGGVYPVFTVALNVPFFIIMAIILGHLAETIRKERDTFQKTTDTFHGLTNALNLKIMNLQAKVDSLSEAYEHLEELDKNKTRFISAVSHELRSPLSSIRAFSEILLNYEDIDTATVKEFIGIINKESERLTQLTGEILDIVRIESGKIQWHMDSVNMGDVILSAVKTMQSLAKGKGLYIEASIPEGIDRIKGDKNKLLQVVLNLLSNSIKFTSQGKITAGVENMQDSVRVFVTDTGEGIYPEEKDKIFDEFYRIGDDLAGRPKGSGLGLSISKKIIEAHEGGIWVESELGKGSTFFFTIPKETAPYKIKETEQFASMDMSGKQLLILEENNLMRQLLRGAFEGLGYITLGANNIKIALELAKWKKPNAIIIGYPKNEEHFDDLRTLSRMQQIPLIVVTLINDEKRGLQAAVNDYVSMPFDKNQILATIENVLRRREGKLLIISDNHEEARNLQLLTGTEGYETGIVSDVTAIDTIRRLPDAIIVGPFQKGNVYNVISAIRNNEAASKTPLILVLNIMIRDIRCAGLNSSEYGGGLNKIVEQLEGAV